MNVREALTPDEIAACHPAMAELRPHLSREAFVAAVQQQHASMDYHLVYIELSGEPACVAGYRITRNLSAGLHLYVDDLVTREKHRRAGLAKEMMHWLEEEARRQHCTSLHLDSGVQRHGAHRLYIGAGMDIVFYHFRKALA